MRSVRLLQLAVGRSMPSMCIRIVHDSFSGWFRRNFEQSTRTERILFNARIVRRLT